MALEEQEEVREHLEEAGEVQAGDFIDDRKQQVCTMLSDLFTFIDVDGSRSSQHYSNLFFLLQTEPRHIATLCRLVSLGEIDTLLQTVMFTLYGNQYESREEHLLLTMFQVGVPLELSKSS